MRYLLILLTLPLLSGCYLTQAGAIKELSEERSARYTAYITAQQQSVTAIADMLKTTDRGGVKLELDKDGRVASISYIERLDLTPLTAISKIDPYREEPVQGVISEVGDFVMKATNLAVPFASIYYGAKNHTETQRANVAISDSNNQANTAMWGAFTSGYQNVSVSDTTNTSVSDISNSVSTDRDYSDTTNTSETSTSVTDTSTTTTTDRDHTEVNSPAVE